MASRDHLLFDVLITGTRADGYVVRLIDSPVGEYSHGFTIPFSEIELEGFIAGLSRAAADARQADDPAHQPELGRDEAVDFGSRLFDAVFDGEMRGMLRHSRSVASEQGAGLRIRLRVKDAPDLGDVPWEFMYDTKSGDFVALSSSTPVVRYLDLPSPPRPIEVTLPLSVLVLISSPDDHATLDVDAEWMRLLDATAELRASGALQLDLVKTATMRELHDRLREGTHHVFHFIGHGDYDEASDIGTLVLETDGGGSHAVTADEIARLLANHQSLRLCVLNSCEGARSSEHDPFSGVAQGLLMRGVPAVVAMQFEITDDAALTFSRELYENLSSGAPVDDAVTEARVALYVGGNEIEWATPVIYMRSPDGRLFDLAAKPPKAPRDNRQLAMVGLLVVLLAIVAFLAWREFDGDGGDDQAGSTTTTTAPTTTVAPTTTSTSSTTAPTTTSETTASSSTTADAPAEAVRNPDFFGGLDAAADCSEGITPFAMFDAGAPITVSDVVVEVDGAEMVIEFATSRDTQVWYVIVDIVDDSIIHDRGDYTPRAWPRHGFNGSTQQNPLTAGGDYDVTVFLRAIDDGTETCFTREAPA